MVAVISVNSQLVDNFKLVFAPIFEIDQHIVQRGAIFAFNVAIFAQGFGGLKGVGVNDRIAQAGKFAVGEPDTVKRLEAVAEVLLKGRLIADVGAIAVFKLGELGDEVLFDVALFHRGSPDSVTSNPTKPPQSL